ncbi:MAG: hypothetical protein KDA79_17630, partial [Planctomycetaceae bacterium]|nr:hypothetical protein [Planctomycetaceae bacterium]
RGQQRQTEPGTLAIPQPEMQEAPLMQRILACFLLATVLTPAAVPAAEPDQPRQIHVLSPATKGRVLTPAEVDEILNRRVDLQLKRTPLNELLSDLGRQHSLPIALDITASEEEGIAEDEPLSADLRRAPLGAALDLLLEEIGLAAVRVPGGLLVTTMIAESDIRTIRSYPVADLLEAGLRDTLLSQTVRELESWLFPYGNQGGQELLTTPQPQEAAPENWVTVKNERLTARLPLPAHRRVEQLLDCLRVALKTGTAISADARDRALEEQLDRPVTVNWQGLQLDHLPKVLHEQWQIPVHVDRNALAEEGLAPDEPLKPLRLYQIPLRYVLKAALDPLGIEFIVHGGILSLTSYPTASYDTVAISAFDLRGPRGTSWMSLAKAVDLIPSATSGMWGELDGTDGLIRHIGGLVVIQQNRRVTHEISTLLTVLRKAVATKEDNQYFRLDHGPAAVRLDQLLRKRISFSGGEGQLQKFIQLLQEHQISVVVDDIALEEEGLSVEEVTVPPLNNLTIAEALDAMLEPEDMTWLNEHGVLRITTDIAAYERLHTAIFPVRDLLQRGFTAPRLIDRIQDVKGATGVWEDIDGTGGSISAAGPLLVVRQNARHFPEIFRRLQHLRNR